MIKAVLFDFDGVIANSKAIHDKSWVYALNTVLKLDLKALPKANISGKSAREIATALCKPYNAADQSETVLACKNAFLQTNLHHIEHLPKVKELFELLRLKDIPFGIASNASKVYVKSCLKNWNLEVAQSYGYEDYTEPKPNPEPYIKLAKFLGISPSDFSNVLVFEDSEPGLLAGIKAGMKTAHIHSHCAVEQDILETTAYSFKALSEALYLFE